MRQVKYSTLTFQIPESWKDVTLSRYNAAIKELQTHKDIPRKAVALAICKLCAIKEVSLYSMTRSQVDQISEAVSFFFDTRPEPRIQMDFEIDGQIFHVPTEIENETFGEFVDMDTTIINHKDDLRDAMAPLMAIYCRPKGEVYNVPDLATRMAERTKLMQNLPIELAEGLAAFFLTCTNERPTITNLYGQERIALAVRVRTIANSQTPMGGLQRLLCWPKTRFLKSMQSRLRDAVRF